MKFIIVAFCIIFSFTLSLYAQSENTNNITQGDYHLKTPDIINQKTSDFFKMLIDGKAEQAFKQILKDSPIREKKERIDELLEQTRRANLVYGPPMSYELVGSESVTESLVRLRYIALHEKFPMRWLFTYYKSPKLGWIIVNIRFDDLSEYLFSE